MSSIRRPRAPARIHNSGAILANSRCDATRNGASYVSVKNSTLSSKPSAIGNSSEPFWQQAYTNLVKFIIQLHKVAYDYVTLFDVYECAINPELLEKRIHEAE